jgi:Tfp pilus assembly protein PilV
MKKFSFKKGVGLIEVLVAAFIFSVILIALITANNIYLSSARSNLRIARASYLVEEGIEAVRTIRDRSPWLVISSLTSTSTLYYLSFSTSTNLWSMGTTSNSVDSDTVRYVTINPVYRDPSSQDIVTDGSGSLDTNTVRVSSYVSLLNNGTQVVKSISTYMTNLLGN